MPRRALARGRNVLSRCGAAWGPGPSLRTGAGSHQARAHAQAAELHPPSACGLETHAASSACISRQHGGVLGPPPRGPSSERWPGQPLWSMPDTGRPAALPAARTLHRARSAPTMRTLASHAQWIRSAIAVHFPQQQRSCGAEAPPTPPCAAPARTMAVLVGLLGTYAYFTILKTA